MCGIESAVFANVDRVLLVLPDTADSHSAINNKYTESKLYKTISNLD